MPAAANFSVMSENVAAQLWHADCYLAGAGSRAANRPDVLNR